MSSWTSVAVVSYSVSSNTGVSQLTRPADGVLTVDIGKVLSQGKGSLHGIDSSPAMIQAADQIVGKDGLKNCTFEGKHSVPPSLGSRRPSDDTDPGAVG